MRTYEDRRRRPLLLALGLAAMALAGTTTGCAAAVEDVANTSDAAFTSAPAAATTGSAAASPSTAKTTSTPTTSTASTTSAARTTGVYGASTSAPVLTADPTSVATDPPRSVPGRSERVVITYASTTIDGLRVQVGAFVAGLVESGGTCTATVTGGSRSTVATVAAAGDASTTTCADMTVDWDPQVPARSVTVTYQSPATDVLQATAGVEQAP